jgi:transcriptional regulator with XRE-family HTH domain
MSTFSERLAKLMALRGLTQKELAVKANITESAISYYVKGLRTPSGEILARMAETLSTTTDYLLGRTDDHNPPPENEQLKCLQRNLGKLDPERLKKAEGMLRAVFDDIFDDDEE